MRAGHAGTVAADDDWTQGPVQVFSTPRTPHAALDAAQVYLEGAGLVSPPLQGRLERKGDALVVHYGRVKTRIQAKATKSGANLEVARHGRGPLEETRRWIFGLGVAGFLLGWGLAWYNSRAQSALPPMVTMTLFFLGIFAAITVLYVIDRSLESRSQSLVGSLRDAMQADPFLVLQREIDGLERSSAIANGVLAYCVSLIIEFIAFAITLGVGTTIDKAVAADLMPASFGLPILPAVAFGIVWFVVSNRRHQNRLALVERRFADLQ